MYSVENLYQIASFLTIDLGDWNASSIGEWGPCVTSVWAWFLDPNCLLGCFVVQAVFWFSSVNNKIFNFR